MALTKCFECGREISELAATCPGCGAPGPAAEGAAAEPPRASEVADSRAGPGRSSTTPPGPSRDAEPTVSGPDQPDPADQRGPSLDEIRAQWRAERAAAGYDDSPTEQRPNAFGFGQSLGEKWSARKVLYIVVGITLVAAIIRPALATVAILGGVAYWTADKLLAPGGRAAEAPDGSGFRTAHEFWVRIGLLGRLGVARVVGVLLGLLTGTLG